VSGVDLPRRGALALAAAVGLAVSQRGLAHVEYVGPEREAGSFTELVGALVADPVAVGVFLGGAIAILAAALAWVRWGDELTDVEILRATLSGYEDLVPWMIRLSVGLPLVGAGFAGYLLTPALGIEVRLLQVFVGFCLLLGLATRAVALLGLVGWISAAMIYGPTLFLAGEFTGAFAALALLGPGRPSVDHMLTVIGDAPDSVYNRVDPVHELARTVRGFLAPARPWAPFLVRVTLGATLAYLGVWEKLVRPGPAIGLAHELGLAGLAGLGAEVWVLGAGLAEAGVGALLVVGLFTRAASAAAFLVLTVTLFALPNDPVLAHVSLFGLASVVFTWGPGPWSVDESG
jgi:uncharacterized membrane protein YphA (DoxX/SURF4 family)